MYIPTDVSFNSTWVAKNYKIFKVMLGKLQYQYMIMVYLLTGTCFPRQMKENEQLDLKQHL